MRSGAACYVISLLNYSCDLLTIISGSPLKATIWRSNAHLIINRKNNGERLGLYWIVTNEKAVLRVIDAGWVL